MIKLLALLSFLLLSMSFNHSWDEGTSSSPSPQGDTRMGADAANSGTDVTDKEIQAQEDKGVLDQNQGPPEKVEIEEEDSDRPVQFN